MVRRLMLFSLASALLVSLPSTSILAEEVDAQFQDDAWYMPPGEMRSWLWPGPGTLPSLLKGVMETNDIRNVYLVQTALTDRDIKGAAIFRFRYLSDGVLSFEPSPLISESRSANLDFKNFKSRSSNDLDLRLWDLSEESKKNLPVSQGELVVLFFDAHVYSGQGYGEVPLSPKDLFSAMNYRIGTEVEQKAALAEFRTLEEKIRKYEQAREDKVASLAAAARARQKKASYPSTATSNQPTYEPTAAPPSSNSAQTEATAPAPPGPAEKLLAFFWARANTGTVLGLIISFGSVSYSVGLFLLGDHQN